MKAWLLQKNLAKVLTHSSRFVSSRAQLPILSNIKLEAAGAKLIISATNLEMSICAPVGADVEKEGDIAVPARVLVELVSSVHAEKILLETKGETLKLSAEGFSASVSGLNTSDFPEIPGKVSGGLDLPVQDFVGALGSVLFSCSPDDTRPALAGVLVFYTNGKLSLVSSDGFRLSQKEIPTEGEVFKVIVPKGVLQELPRISQDAKNLTVLVNNEDKQILFALDDVVLSSRLVEGEYPPFEKIIPESSSISISINREEFKNAIKTAAVFARDGTNTVSLYVDEGSLKVSAESAVSGSGEVSIPAKVDGPAIAIAYNYRYIEEFLGVAKGESIELKFNSPDKAGVFLDTEDKNYLHLIMPVKS